MMRKVLHVVLLAGLYVWSVAPVLSFIQQTAGGASVLEICTPDGFAKVALNDVALNDIPGDGNSQPEIKCPFCSVAAYGGAALDAPDMAAWQALEYPPQISLRLAAHGHAPAKNYEPGRSAPVRAPPVFS